jgi:hypothetical protein
MFLSFLTSSLYGLYIWLENVLYENHFRPHWKLFSNNNSAAEQEFKLLQISLSKLSNEQALRGIELLVPRADLHKLTSSKNKADAVVPVADGDWSEKSLSIPLVSSKSSVNQWALSISSILSRVSLQQKLLRYHVFDQIFNYSNMRRWTVRFHFQQQKAVELSLDQLNFICTNANNPSQLADYDLQSSFYYESQLGCEISAVGYNNPANHRYPVQNFYLHALLSLGQFLPLHPYPRPAAHFHSKNSSLALINWAETFSCNPSTIYSDDALPYKDGVTSTKIFASPRTAQDCRTIIAHAQAHNCFQISLFGACHSFNPLSATQHCLVDARFLSTINSPAPCNFFSTARWPQYYLFFNPANSRHNLVPTITFSPGISTGDLERFLAQNGSFRLPTSTVEDVFTMGGIIATASHGTGRVTGIVADWVVAVEIIDSQGEISVITPENCPEKWLQGSKLTQNQVWRCILANLGSMAIILRLTMKVERAAPIVATLQLRPWAEFFADNDSARQNLLDLAQNFDSIEFFYMPLELKFDWLRPWRSQIQPNEKVLVLLGLHRDIPWENPVISRLISPQLVSAPSELYWFWLDVQFCFGCNALGHAISAMTRWRLFFPLALLLISLQNLFIFESNPPRRRSSNAQGSKHGPGGAYKCSNWRLTHPFNAVGGIEEAKILNQEFFISCGNLANLSEITAANRSFGDILRLISAQYYATNSMFDRERFPVTCSVEMRIFGSSPALLAPNYHPSSVGATLAQPSQQHYWCGPEIISTPGAATENFLVMLNNLFSNREYIAGRLLAKDQPRGVARYHPAKYFFKVPGAMENYRKDIEDRGEEGGMNGLEMFNRVRRAVDPAGLFLNKFTRQLLGQHEL